MKLRSIGLVAGLVLAMASVAQAGTKKYKLKSNATTTDRTGNKSKNNGTVGSDGEFRGLYSVVGYEQNDNASFRMKARHLNTNDSNQYDFPNSTVVNAGKSAKTVAFTDTDTYIRGAAVCLNSRGTEIKGLRIYGTKLNRTTGALNNLSGKKEWKRTNCKTWKTPVYCPVGKIATKVTIDWESKKSTYYTGMSGLKLVCRTVEPK
jgi:hypothetical protein